MKPFCCRKEIHNNQKGFTLVELIVVLALMGLVIGTIYSFFGFSHNTYANAEAQSIVSQEATLFFTQIEKDIRNASEPNDTSKAIHIVNEEQINIYQYDGDKYHLISYRRNPENNRLLERGYATSDGQVSGLNPSYGSIDNWKTVIANLVPGTAEIFSDRNPDDTLSVRRLIDVNLSLQHPRMMTAVNMNTSVMNRSGRSTDSLETGGGSYSEYIPVEKIIFSTEPSTFPKAGGTGATIVAKVLPPEATNKNLVWSQQIISAYWLSFPEYSLRHDDGTGSTLESLVEGASNKLGYWNTITTRSGSKAFIDVSKFETLNLPTWLLDWFIDDHRSTEILVTSPDGPYAKLTITQQRD